MKVLAMVVCPRPPLSCCKMVISLILSINSWQCLREAETKKKWALTSANKTFIPREGKSAAPFPLCVSLRLSSGHFSVPSRPPMIFIWPDFSRTVLQLMISRPTLANFWGGSWDFAYGDPCLQHNHSSALLVPSGEYCTVMGSTQCSQ